MTLCEFFRLCSTLPGRIESHNSNKNFLREFQQLFGSQEARDTSSVLYAFFCEKKIPRVKGESNVIYIGKTKQSLRWRYLSYAKRWYCSPYNWVCFSHVIEHYGPVGLAYLVIDDVQSLKEAELDLLKDYYELHLERPPKNARGYGSWGGWITNVQ